ncbi:hypothetical protein FLLO111716_02015 [Flavobacterium longum]|uniref:toxin-antitoxin system YwqK family antitoxin n=1 Tax=Flavobacterium longum TaxID=1299340 RepID=UPI0039EAB2D0
MASRFSLLLLCCVFVMAATAQEKQYFDKDWKPTTREQAVYYRVVRKEGTLFLVNDYYANGQLQFSGTSSVAAEPLQLEGKAIWYSPNGKAEREAEFSANQPNGLMTEYYVNGAKKSVVIYKNGKLEGLQQQFFPSGAIRREQTIVDGIYQGRFVEYRTETAKAVDATFKDGKPHGRYAFYKGEDQRPEAIGNAVNGVQDGECTNYDYEGRLTRKYTVRGGLLDGDYFEYDGYGKPSVIGKFKAGKVVAFKVISKKWNDSDFSSELVVEGGIEKWKIFRDGKLVGDLFYTDGRRTGNWKFYTFDGKKLFLTKDYSNAECKTTEAVIQAADKDFRPLFRLSDRFRLDADIMRDDCENVVKKYHLENGEDQDQHPFYYIKPAGKVTDGNIDYHNVQDVKSEGDGLSLKLSGTIRKDFEYIEPADAKEFIAKNKCAFGKVPGYPEMMTCERSFGPTVYKLYFSKSAEDLEKLRTGIKPQDNEIHFFYQKYESRLVKAGEKTRDRYMAWKLPEVTIEALREKILDYIIVGGRIESDFFTAETFYGSTAFDALEKEFKSKN